MPAEANSLDNERLSASKDYAAEHAQCSMTYTPLQQQNCHRGAGYTDRSVNSGP